MNKQKLREMAEKATHGPWIAGDKAIKQRDELLAAMKMIAGQIQCPDTLMGNVDIALAAIAKAESS